MPKTLHTVVQPEHLASIADDNELASFAKTWNDPDNADLRKRRELPHLLLPGDVITIPEREPLLYDRPTGKQHTFTVQITPLKLRLVVLDEFEKPVANTAGTLIANGNSQDVETDGDGLIEATIDNGTVSASLTLGPRSYTFRVGQLDPIDEPTGQLGRLKALGYFDGDVPEAADYEDAKRDFEVALHLAWEVFQDENGLTLTGIADDDSVSKLKEVFGS